MASISGKNAGGTIGGNIIGGCHAYTFDEAADDLDGTAGEDGGFANPDAGVLGGTVRLDIWFDKARASYVAIRASTEVADLVLYDDLTGDPVVTIPVGIVMTSTKKSETRGRIEVSATIKTKGEYTVADPS